MDVCFVSLLCFFFHYCVGCMSVLKKNQQLPPALNVTVAFLWWPYIVSNETCLLVLTCLLTQYSMVYSTVK